MWSWGRDSLEETAQKLGWGRGWPPAVKTRTSVRGCPKATGSSSWSWHHWNYFLLGRSAPLSPVLVRPPSPRHPRLQTGAPVGEGLASMQARPGLASPFLDSLLLLQPESGAPGPLATGQGAPACPAGTVSCWGMYR